MHWLQGSGVLGGFRVVLFVKAAPGGIEQYSIFINSVNGKGTIVSP